MIKKFLLKKELKELLLDFKYSLFRVMKYQIGTKACLTILIPIFMFFVNLLLRKKGFYTITNSDLLGFSKSYEGIISAIILFLMSLFIILIELGGLVAISGQSYHRQSESSFYSILRFSLKSLPNFFGIGGFFISIFFIILMPFFNIGPTTSLIQQLSTPGFIKVYIDQSLLYSIIYFILLAILIFFSLRWMFALHFIILDGLHPKQALKESSILVKNNWKFILKHFISISLGLFTILFSLLMIWLFGIEFIMNDLGLETAKSRFFISLLILIQDFVTFLFAFFTIPFEIQHLTKIFYTLKQDLIFPFKIPEKQGLSMMDKVFKRKKTIGIVFISTILLFSWFLSLFLDELTNIKYQTQITSHRANTTIAPENSLSAIKIAISNESDYAEIDVQESKDGQIFVHHDSNLKASTGLNQAVWNLDYSDIKKLSIGQNFSDEYKNERIPLLKEAIDISQNKIKLNIEIKKNGHEKNLVKSVVDIIKDNDFIDSCVITSLDYDVLEEVEKLAPEIKTGYIMYFAKGDLSSLNVDFYSIEESNISDALIADAHLQNREVHAWTVNKEDDMLRLIKMDVDNIITDDDLLLKDVLNTLKNESKMERIQFIMFE